jgi:hypothetical protein
MSITSSLKLSWVPPPRQRPSETSAPSGLAERQLLHLPGVVLVGGGQLQLAQLLAAQGEAVGDDVEAGQLAQRLLGHQGVARPGVVQCQLLQARPQAAASVGLPGELPYHVAAGHLPLPGLVLQRGRRFTSLKGRSKAISSPTQAD